MTVVSLCMHIHMAKEPHMVVRSLVTYSSGARRAGTINEIYLTFFSIQLLFLVRLDHHV